MRKDKEKCGVTRPQSGARYIKDDDRTQLSGTCPIPLKSKVFPALDPATSMTVPPPSQRWAYPVSYEIKHVRERPLLRTLRI